MSIAMLLLTCVAHAQQGNRLSMLVDVDDDGSAVVMEELELAVPMHEPIFWRMPTASISPVGVRRLFLLDVLEISDGAGNSIVCDRRHGFDTFDITIPVQSLARNSLRITYEIRNAVGFREDRAELSWYVGYAWSAPIDHAELSVNIPQRAVGETVLQIVRGTNKVNSIQAIAMQGKTAAAEIAGPWRRNREPAIDLMFAPGVLQQPSSLRTAAWFLEANPAVSLLLVLLAIGLLFRKWSDRNNPAVTPRYTPPDDLPPAEAGYLIDGRLDPCDVSAMLLDLAHRGFIRIEAAEPDEGVPYTGPDFVLRLLKPMDDWNAAYPYEHTMLFHTFYGGHWTKLSSLSLRFYSFVPILEEMVRLALESKQLYRHPSRFGAHRLLAAIVLIVTLLIVQFGGWFAVTQSALLLIAVVVSIVPVMMLFRRGGAHLTAKGTRVLAELRGFEEFMNSVEGDRMQRITPDLFEKYLPYAVALGVEHNWASTFSTISSGPPLWWDAEKAGSVPDFIRLVRSFAYKRPPRAAARTAPPPPVAVAASAPTSSPRTSS